MIHLVRLEAGLSEPILESFCSELPCYVNVDAIRIREGLELAVVFERLRKISPTHENMAMELFQPIEVVMAAGPVLLEGRDELPLFVVMLRKRSANGSNSQGTIDLSGRTR